MPNWDANSFVSGRPVCYCRIHRPKATLCWQLQQELAQFQSAPVPEFAPFQGGLRVLLGYGLSRCLERIPLPAFRRIFKSPRWRLGLYDVVLAFDHARVVPCLV